MSNKGKAFGDGSLTGRKCPECGAELKPKRKGSRIYECSNMKCSIIEVKYEARRKWSVNDEWAILEVKKDSAMGA